MPSAGRRPITILLALALLGATLGLAACSSEDDGDATYLESLDGIVAAAGEETTELADKLPKAKSIPGAADLLNTFAGSIRRLSAQIDRIEPPARVRRLHRSLVELLGDLSAKARKAGAALKADGVLGALELGPIAADAVRIGERIDATLADIAGRLDTGA